MAGWPAGRPADAAQIQKIPSYPQAIWWEAEPSHPYELARETTLRISGSGSIPAYVLYKFRIEIGVPQWWWHRSGDAYRSWVGEIAAGIGENAAVVILEPDVLAGMDCLPGDLRSESS